jgi:hypothetical protein
MNNVHCYTSASFSYIDRVRVLGETLREYHPDWKFSLCLCDREPPGFKFEIEKEPIDELVRIEDLGIAELDQWIFMHDVIELCTAVKGSMLCRLLDAGAPKIIYLDPDIALFSDLHEIEDLLDRYEVILTPHQTSPAKEKQAIIDNEICSMKHGIYNLGFIAVANRIEGRRFADWWRSRLLEFCFADIPNGLFTDQRWCDHVPAMFSDVHILRDPGYNVASWNLGHRPVTIEPDGSIRASGNLLRFFHFTKIFSVGAVMIERYGGASLAAHELVNWYCKRVAAHAASGVPAGWWAFDRYADGSQITNRDRVAYRTRPDLRKAFPNPFWSFPLTLAAYLESENRQ